MRQRIKMPMWRIWPDRKVGNIHDVLNLISLLMVLILRKYLFAAIEYYALLRDAQSPFRLVVHTVCAFIRGKELLFQAIVGILPVRNHSRISVLSKDVPINVMGMGFAWREDAFVTRAILENHARRLPLWGSQVEFLWKWLRIIIIVWVEVFWIMGIVSLVRIRSVKDVVKRVA